MASLEMGIIIAIIGIVMIVFARLIHIDRLVNKLLYIVGAIVFVIGIIAIILALVGYVV